MRGVRGGAVRTLLLVLAVATPVGASAQDTQQQEEPVDSARARVLEQLELLARPIGFDSVLYTRDSLELAAAAEGNRSIGGADAVAAELLRMPGYSLTEYEAETADFAALDRVLVLRAADGGRARVTREGLVFEADTSITFDEQSGRLTSEGMATFTPPDGDPVDAARMIYDLNEARGSAFDATTAFNQDGATWIVDGQMPYAAQDSTFMAHAQFTSCDLDHPHYHFETNEIKIVGGNVLVARGVKLYFADVPVAWLPFMAQSLERGRASGLLTPRFSVNDIVRTSGGYRRRISNVGFFWALNDYSDALVSMDWFSDTFFSLTGAFRYTLNKHFLNGDANVRNYWREDGSTEPALDTRHNWDIDERTQLRASARYVQNNDFVREFSFNPQEVTQSIDSEAGLNRRFDWGSLSMSANRKQFLSDDRTEWLLPSANLSLSPITLFAAPSSDASFWNNMTWSGSSGFRRNTVDRLQPDTFAISSANTGRTQSFARSNLSIGNLTFSQSVDLSENQTLGVPEALLMYGDTVSPTMLVGGPVRDIRDSNLSWQTSVNYQQQLIGSTTITPRLSLSGEMFRSDTSTIASSFVGAPSRMSFGAQLKTDIYGFFPGFGSFEAVRHKISPSFDYQYSPESVSTPLQDMVFGQRALNPKNIIALTFAQTFEAKRAQPEESDTAAVAEAEAPVDPFGEPRRIPQAEVVSLLAIRTSVVQYDFVEADEVGSFLGGFQTTQLQNQVASDYLRGLSLSMSHDLFEDNVAADGTLSSRTFSPHMSQVNLGFSLGSSSSIFRWLGFGGGGDDARPEEPDPEDPLDLPGPQDETLIVPVAGRDPVPQQQQPNQPRSGGIGGWTANLSYALQRPRDPTQLASEMISGTLRLKPTVNWSVSWRTAYDLEARAFNDHSIRLTRDLHRWQANFDFLQTATGNWTFRFEVSLTDNRDLKFDYKQRNLDLGLPNS